MRPKTLPKLLHCPKCGYPTKQTKTLEKHILKEHGCDPEQLYIELFCNNIPPTCECGCGTLLKWWGWSLGYPVKYVKGHNARVYSAFSEPEIMEKIVKQRCEEYASGKREVWNKGLTKEGDERIAKSRDKAGATAKERYKNGELVSWQKGLTAETDERMARIVENRKKKFKSGELKIWSTGLTKETDDRVAKVAQKMLIFRKTTPGFKLSDEEMLSRLNKHNDKFEILEHDETGEKINLSGKYLRGLVKFKCKECNNTIEKDWKMMRDAPVCHICHPKESSDQLELFQFVNSLCPDAICSSRNIIPPKELDIYVPNKRIAVEYNGVYWHCDKFLKDDYHINKTNLCNSNNIQLIHIFSDEWETKQDIVKSILKNKLGLNTHKIPARKCSISLATPTERRLFFNTTHLDGDVNSTVSWKLTYDNQIVAVLSLRKAFHNKYKNYMEVARFSSSLETSVMGGLSKLLKQAAQWTAQNGFQGIITYVDTRFGDGHGYESAGFKHISTTQPRFWWTDYERRYNRFKFRANKTEGLTQEQVAMEAGVAKIFCCPNKLYLLDLTIMK
jgi:hypothetical protein